MDLDSDGHLDILSGSYSREGEEMAGLFQVLWGEEDGTFRAAEALNGSNGEALVLPMGEGESGIVQRICTRAFAADLDGDGELDLVSGNFGGTFALFHGEGEGQFAPTSAWLEADGEPMQVPHHSDPFLCDWDADGDLDLLSGSAEGGAFLFPNIGSKTEPEFGASITLVEPVGHVEESDALGDAHLTGPGKATRVWADDLSGDGKLDLLVGDAVTLYHAAEGVEASVARAKLGVWREAMSALMSEQADDFSERYKALNLKRDAFVTEDRTGFVWVLVQE